jgi:hypothetical protein
MRIHRITVHTVVVISLDSGIQITLARTIRLAVFITCTEGMTSFMRKDHVQHACAPAITPIADETNNPPVVTSIAIEYRIFAYERHKSSVGPVRCFQIGYILTASG